MNRQAATLISLRATDVDYIDFRFLIGNVVFTITFCVLWLIPINSDQILGVVNASLVGVLAELPVFFAINT